MEKIKAISYSRVSKDCQKTPEQQHAENKEAIKNNGQICIAEYTDEESSQAGEFDINVFDYIEKRQGLTKIIELAKQKKFQVLWVWKLSRLCRDGSFQTHIKRVLAKYGIIVWSTIEGTDESVHLIYGAINQIENIQKSHYTKLGKKASFNKGAFQGSIPPGYKQTWNPPSKELRKNAKVKISIDHDKAQKIIDAFSLAAQNHPLTEISTKTGFSKKSLRIMLRNRTYLGELWYKDLHKKKNHPPLISNKLYEEVQKVLNKRITKKSNNAVDAIIAKGVKL